MTSHTLLSGANPAPGEASLPAGGRADYYDRIRPLGLTPLWEVLHALVPREPASPCVPAHWRWSDVWPLLQDAGRLITAEEAVRRVLILENPALRGQSCITQSLYAGLQLILPGEIAPSHRHTQSALRFVVHGKGAFTAVNGERVTMQPGDFIITPSWTWHDHGNLGDEPVAWLDGLDIPLIRFLDAGFAENGSAAQQKVTRAEGTSMARYGANMLPVRYDAPHGATSPIFCYPYAHSKAAVLALAAAEPPDAWDGVKLEYVNPATGGPAITTMATYLQWLPAATTTRATRTTASTVVSVVEGRGTVVIAQGQSAPLRFALGPKDHIVVPPWASVHYEVRDAMVLFSYSDAPMQRALGVLRDERL
jgi:gentisate 1,2-dioxygenase